MARREGAPKAGKEKKPTRAEKILHLLDELGGALAASAKPQGGDFEQTDFQKRGVPEGDMSQPFVDTHPNPEAATVAVPSEPSPENPLGPDVDESGIVNPYMQSGVTEIHEPASTPENTPVATETESGQANEGQMRRDAFRVLKYHEMGVPMEEIAGHLRERGLSARQAADTLKMMKSIDKTKKTKEKVQAEVEKRALSEEKKNMRALGKSLGQVETKRGAAYSERDTSRVGREMKRQTAVDEGPLTQVETTPGLATEPEVDATPRGRVMTRSAQPVGGSPAVVETKPTEPPTLTDVVDDLHTLWGIEERSAEHTVGAPATESTPSNLLDEFNIVDAQPQQHDQRSPYLVAGEGPTEDATAGENHRALEAAVEAYRQQLDAYHAQRRGAAAREATERQSEWQDTESQEDTSEATDSPKLAQPETREAPRDYLNNRSREMDAEAAKMGRIEKSFRWMGEKYNMLGWKSKIALGLSLGIGAGVASVFSFPTAVALLGGIAAQRVAGMSSAFLKFEQNSQEGRWRKEAAMAKAMGQAALMTGAMMLLSEAVKEGVSYARDHQVGEWLKQHWPFGGAGAEAPKVARPASALPESPASAAVQSASAPEAAKAAAEAASAPAPAASAPEMAAAPEAAASAPAEVAQPAVEAARPVASVETSAATTAHATMPSVEATKGHGYEYMMKRLWENADFKKLDPTKFAEGSDVRRLLEATPADIDKIVHQIAADPSHSFANSVGSSVKIDLSAKMTVGEDGFIHMSDAKHTDFVDAEPGMGVTKPPVGAEQLSGPLPHTETEEFTNSHFSARAETPGVDDTQTSPAPEAQPEPRPLDATHNQAGLPVPPDRAHIYTNAAASEAIAYGGSPAELQQTIAQYLKSHEQTVVIGADPTGQYRVAWHLAGDKLEASAPLKTGGFLGLFSQTLPPPNPEEFRKIIT